MNTGKPGVLLDVDGTLLDTNYLHALAWWQAFRDAAVVGVSMADAHQCVGLGSSELVDQLAGEADDRTKRMVVKRHRKRYAKLRDQVVALTGADHLVRRCVEAGLTVAVATSGERSDLDWMLPAIGVEEDLLAGVTTSGDVERSKPAPDLLTKALEEHDLDPSRTVMIGDTVYDVAAARRAGVRLIAFTSGGIARCDLLDAGADEVFAGPADLVDRWDESLLGRLA